MNPRSPHVISFAYSAVGWTTPTDQDASRPVAISEVAMMLKDTGLDGVEGFGLFEPLTKDLNLAQSLREAGMGFSGAYASGSFVETERLEHEIEKFCISVDKIAELGGSTVVVGGGRIYPNERERDWPIFIQTIKQLARIAHEKGVQFGYHPHKGTLVFTPEEIERFVKDTEDVADIVGLTLDTGHTAVGGGDVLAIFAKYHARTLHIHLKDVKRTEGATSFSEHDTFVPLGAGDLQIKDVIAAAWERGYRGWMTVELDASKNALGDAIKGIENLRMWLDHLYIPNRLKM